MNLAWCLDKCPKCLNCTRSLAMKNVTHLIESTKTNQKQKTGQRKSCHLSYLRVWSTPGREQKTFFFKKKPPMMRSECEIIRVIPRPPQSIDIEDFAPSGRWWYCSSWFHVDNACRPRWRRREATPRDGGCAEQKRYYNARVEKIGIHPPLSFFTRSPVAHSHSVSLSL
jgi:hypothetical protein